MLSSGWGLAAFGAFGALGFEGLGFRGFGLKGFPGLGFGASRVFFFFVFAVFRC